MKQLRLKGACAGIAIAATLSGCAGAPTRFYTLDAAPGPSQAPSGYTGPAFRIDAVHIPPAFDRPELVRQTVGEQFTVSDNDHWAAPLGELVRRALTQDLAARLPSGDVIFPDAPKPAGAEGLVVDILALTPTDAGEVMEASWTLLPGRSAPGAPAPPALQQHTVRVSTAADGRGVGGNAAELSALTGMLADRIVSTLNGAGPP